MKYVFDSGAYINLRQYYPNIFKSFWDKFNNLVSNDMIISPAEVLKELEKKYDFIYQWAKSNREIFLEPTDDELGLVRDILRNHKELIKLKSLRGGKPVADPFVIAQAISRNLIVVSTEKVKKGAHNIPNICEEYGVRHLNSEEFMQNERWSF